MAEKPKILHVDDESVWQKTVRSSLRDHFDIEFFSSLTGATGARHAFATGRFDLAITDSSIEWEDDGTQWAITLQSQGKKVILLPRYPSHSGVPSICKGSFVGSDMVALINEQLKLRNNSINGVQHNEGV